MGNGNGFIPPEAKKAQQPQGSSFVPPEAKKKDFGQPSLGGSEELTESPYTPTNLEEVKQEDVFIMSPQQASTAPIGDVKKSIDAARKFYGADLNQALVKEGVVIPSKRSQEFNELVDIYNSKIINGEGTSNDRYELAQTKTANEYISSLLDQGIVTEEEVKDLTSLNEIYKLVAEKKSMAEGVGAWADAPRAFGTEIQAPQGKDYIVNSIIKEQNKEYYDLLAKNILETIPPEQRTTDNLERIEQELFEENDLIVDLTGEGRVGEGQNAFKNFALKTQKGLEDVAMTIGAYKSAVDPSMWMTGKPIGALGIDYANKFRKEELDRLEKKITQYDSNMTELLSKGNYMGAIDLGLQTTGESVAPMAVAAAVSFATGNPYAGYAAISAYSGGQRYLDVKDEPWFQALNPWGKLAYNTVYGTSEGLTEAVGARIAGRLVKGLLIGDDAANRGLREYLKEFAKIQGLNVIEEVPAEVVTGITQMISEKVAKGEEITMKDINETAIESGLGALFMTGAIGSLGTLKIPLAAANSLKVKKSNKAAKEAIDDINNAQTPEEKVILSEKLMQIEDVRNSLISSEGERLKQFSDEDLNTYTEKVAEFNRLQSQLEGLPEGSKAAEVIQERMQNVVNDITAINDKYEQAQQQPKEQTNAIQEQETDEVDVRQQAGDGEKVGEEVRSTEEETRGTPEGEVQEEVVDKRDNIKDTPITSLKYIARGGDEREGFYGFDKETATSYSQADPEQPRDIQEGFLKEDANVLYLIEGTLENPKWNEKNIKKFQEITGLSDEVIKDQLGIEDAADITESLWFDSDIRQKLIDAGYDAIVGWTIDDIYPYVLNEDAVSYIADQPKSPTPQKILGETPSKTTKKVTMTDKALVKQRIQDMVKASREGYREGRREIKDFASQIKEMFKEVKSGIFKPSQVRALTTRAAEVSTPTQMKRFEEYATKVLDDAQYAEDLAKSYKTRAKVKIGGKAPSNIQSAFQRFKRIDPAKVDDLAEYNRIANGLLGYKGRPIIKLGEEVTASEKQTLPISEINDYIDNYNKSQEGSVRETLIEQNQELVDLGIIDESLTADEIQSIIDAISDPQPDESVFDRMQDSQRKTEAFKRIISYSQEDLKGIPQQEITKEQREVKDALENIDVDQVESNQLPFLYSSLRNAIDNNAYNGAYRIVADYKAQRNIPQAQGLRNKAARTISSFDFNVTNIRSVFRALTGHSEFASRLLNLMGLSSLFDGNAKAQRAKENISKEISNLIGKRFNTIEENVFLSIYDTLLTAGQENFTYYKDAINEMINNDLKSSDTDLRKSAQIAKEVFDKRIKDAKNINQIKITASEKKVSDFFGKAFKDIAPRFKDISENVYNIEFIESDNYRPLLWRRRSDDDKNNIGINNSYFYQRNVRPTKDGSLNQRTYKVDPARQTFEYDYINGMVNKYANQILDIETAKSVFDYNAFMKHPKSLDALGNDKNKQAINQRIKRYVESNHTYSTLNPVQKMVVDVFNAFAKIGARVKLGGVSQVFVQSVPVFVRTIAILNRDAGTITDGIGLRVQDNEAFNNLIDNYPISTRGLIRQEFKSAERSIAKATRDKWRNKMGTAYQNIDELLDKIQMLPIEWSDVETAKTTWFAYYLQNLKRRGLYDGSQTMEQLSQNPDDQAASYAEQMVAETQVPSDVQQNGNWLVPSDGVANAARRIAFPFIMFRTTQAYSIWNTFTNGIKGIGDKQSQGIFLKELSGVMGENIVFSGFSYARYLASLGAASFIASLFGVDLDKDDEETKKDKYTAWWVKSIGDGLMELNPIYGYGFIDKMQVRAMNRFYFSVFLTDEQKQKYINQKELNAAKTDKEYELVMEKAINNFEKTKNAPVRDWSSGKGDEWYEVLGQAGFLPEIINQAEETFDMSKQEQYEYISKWNTTVEVELSEEERNLLIMSGILQYANLVAPKELGDAGRRIKSGVIYKGDKGSGRGSGRSSSRSSGR